MHPRSLFLASALLVAGLGLHARPAGALPPGYSLEVMHESLSFPTALRFAPDGRLFYLELLSGRVMVFPDSSSGGVAAPWATIPVDNTNERGLLGMAFHPDFPDSPYVYLYHSTVEAPHVNRVVRMTDSAGVGTAYTVLLDSLPGDGLRHQGGRLAFGPDGMLYVTTGEQGDPDNSHDLSSPMGKILRLDPLGRPAPGNPFGASSPIFAIGIRNAFGLCFDPASGEGYFTDNGPDCDDELNHLETAGDYGWSNADPCDGDPPGTLSPMWRETPTVAPTGCCFFEGDVYPGMSGNLFFGSYNDGGLRRVVLHPGAPGIADTVETFLLSFGDNVLDVTEGPDGRLWYVTFTRMLRIREPIASTGVEGGVAGATFTVRPNPFTGAVALVAPAGVRFRALEIVDLSGRRVWRWASPPAGGAVWDGRRDDGCEAPAGVYFVRAETGAGTLMRRVVRLARR